MSEEDELGATIFGWVGTAIATYFYIAPVVPYLKLIRGELKINEVPGFLLICSFFNCILWTGYALLYNQFNNYFANGLGGTITLIFITIFLVYFAEKKICYRMCYRNLFHMLFYFASGCYRNNRECFQCFNVRSSGGKNVPSGQDRKL